MLVSYISMSFQDFFGTVFLLVGNVRLLPAWVSESPRNELLSSVFILCWALTIGLFREFVFICWFCFWKANPSICFIVSCYSVFLFPRTWIWRFWRSPVRFHVPHMFAEQKKNLPNLPLQAIPIRPTLVGKDNFPCWPKSWKGLKAPPTSLWSETALTWAVFPGSSRSRIIRTKRSLYRPNSPLIQINVPGGCHGDI